MDFNYLFGQIPLSEEEIIGLRIKTIGTQADLDQHEKQNIHSALQWLRSKKPATAVILTDGMIIGVHKRMFSEVWSWAGIFRRGQKKVGVDVPIIMSQLKALLDDAQFQVLARSYGPGELAIRVNHRLVILQCFPNGNGRHSRLVADALVESLGRPAFTWGSSLEDSRIVYIKALKAADMEDYSSLIDFARS